MYCAVYAELQANEDVKLRGSSQGWGAVDRLYFAAFDADETFPLHFFGRPHRSWGTRSVPKSPPRPPGLCAPRLFDDPNVDFTGGNQKAYDLQRQSVRRMLLYREFASHFAGYGAVTKEEAVGLTNDRWSIHLRRLVPPYIIQQIRDAYGAMVRGKMLRYEKSGSSPDHNGPIPRLLTASILPRIESVTSRSLHPTYTYFGSYETGGGMAPRTGVGRFAATK
eukprot:gene5982-17466_t